MKENRHDNPSDAQRDRAMNKYPGAAVDHANDGSADEKSVQERTCAQNNNPRNHK